MDLYIYQINSHIYIDNYTNTFDMELISNPYNFSCNNMLQHKRGYHIKISDYDIGCVKCWRCNWARLFERSFGVFQVHKLPLLHFYCWLWCFGKGQNKVLVQLYVKWHKWLNKGLPLIYWNDCPCQLPQLLNK